ncbi:TonB-dependent receptor [Mucilaginibacter robiniae]|uniref:TonB-dependent receptor n=1 Tax=Mucilaginibacter robiniae TaxID=2728022 RepID=A0A7L5E1J1_9SPHI|nr:TonB-dependent receptor [Mucilaginibacter robiniae]QJD97232.1 TonB-dependent receptor [Mucilaginibacter robiniae]
MRENLYYLSLQAAPKHKIKNKILILCAVASLFNALPQNATAHTQNYNPADYRFEQLPQVPPKVTGKVTDEKGSPLIGVSIKVKGTTNGTVSDINGNFSVNVPDGTANPTLVVSYIGYLTQELAVNDRAQINVQLKESANALSDVVVVGYNTVKRTDVTSSVVSVSAEEIRSRPVANALQAIQGKAAGVDVTSSERPGEIGSIRIRGNRSLNATNNPLYVVDGIPLSSGGIENINPNDIEAIDILKDASATAIYGSRGANGVVVVTTKRGKAGRLSLEYVGTSTIEGIKDRLQLMNSGQYIEFRRDAYRRLTYLNNFNPTLYKYTNGYPNGAPTLAADAAIFPNDAVAFANIQKGYQNGAWDGSLVPTTDWTGMVKRTGVTQDHIVSASGGTDKVKAYSSFGFLHQEGTQLGQDYTRYSAKVSVDVNPVKWFAMGGTIDATFSKQNYGFSTTNATGPGSLYAAAQGMLPYAVPFDANGNRINLPGGDVNILNPIGEDQYNINLRKVTRTLGSFYAEVTFLKGLKYRVNFGPDFYNNNNGRWMDQNSINRGGGEPGSTNYAQLNQTNNLSWSLDNLIYFDKMIGKHSFGITLLQNSTSYRQETSSMTATKLPYNSQLWYQLNSVSALDAFSTNLVQSSLVSYLARFNYNFNSKYILTAFGRWDGASQLAPGHKWDFFPSLSLAWRLDQENFIKKISWIDELKLRAGVGITGNAAIGPYSTEGVLQTLYYTYGSSVQPGYVSSDASLANPISFPNPQLGWEHTRQYNLGIDFNVLKGRVNGALDLYTSRTTDLLLLRNILSINGYTTSLTNVGETANKGFEITLNTVNIKSRDFNWTSTLNFGANKDRIVSLANGKVNDINNLWFIGQRLNVYYDYVKDRIWQNTPEDLAEMAKYKANGQIFNPGDIKVVDQNGDYKIDANNDRVVRGSSSPSWTGGITNTFTYKGIELSAFIFSRWNYLIQTGAESLQGRFAQRVVNYWTPTNPTNDYPSPNYNSAAGDAFKSSMNYQDGSFIKIRNITLGYFIPTKLVKKVKLSRVKVYAQALNPGLIYSKVNWIDPDLGTSNYNRGVVFGINVGF